MALQINARIPDVPQNLVLYMDFSFLPDRKKCNFYVATLYVPTKATLDAFPSWPGADPADRAILHSTGTRLEEWQATLTFIDILLGYHPAKGNRNQMDSWFLQLQNSDVIQYQICNKIYIEGKLQNISLPGARLLPLITNNSPKLVLAKGYSLST